MATHEVSFTLPERALGRADAQFRVKQGNRLIGTLAISNGSIVWWPSGTSYGRKMSWGDFNEMMEANARRYEKR